MNPVSFPEPGQDLIMALGTVVGVVQCFFGYRVFKLVLALVSCPANRLQ
jgi:hypothetical protein